MGKNTANKINISVRDMLRAHLNDEYVDAIANAKRAIEQICIALLKKKDISPVTYRKNQNREVLWGLEDLITNCDSNDLIPSNIITELLLVKDWRNDIEHNSLELLQNRFSAVTVEAIRKLYIYTEKPLGLSVIKHWPDNLQSYTGNMLSHSVTSVSMEKGQLVIQGENGQRTIIDFEKDAVSKIDGNGNKTIYKGNISEGDNNKGWAG